MKTLLLKALIFLMFFLFITKSGISQQKPEVKQSTTTQAGFERTERKGNEGTKWAWGTMGHGSYDQTIELFKSDEFFKPEKDVLMYKQGPLKYRVFTHANINYIEVDYGFGYYTYITKS